MGYSTKIILDSVNHNGDRLTTYEITNARLAHADFLTHRQLSRNSSSSRAIPAAKLREKILADPVIPKQWGKNRKGMKATEEVDDPAAALAWWLEGLALMAEHHKKGEALGLHKQIVNRVIEPWMFITVIVSATNFDNFFFLRDHEDAQPELAWIAGSMYDQYQASRPTRRGPGEWHLPYILPEDFGLANNDVEVLKKISVARCARVSYLTHDGRKDFNEDLRLHNDLVNTTESDEPGHFSPFEHQACALASSERSGNFVGWRQYRKDFAKEAGPDKYVRKPRKQN
jgi:hypothetical protein